MANKDKEFEIKEIYHLAAILSTRAELAPTSAHDVNVNGMLNMLELALKQSKSQNKNVKFLLTTHFIKLCKLLEKEKFIENNSMKTIINNDIPEYFYKIQTGISKVKGGITVLKESNYPEEIINMSRKIIDKIN